MFFKCICKEMCNMRFAIAPKSILESDVVVIGGGTAGVFAAISAAKNGIKTVLVEKTVA